MLRGTVFVAPIAAGTEGALAFDPPWVSEGTPDDYMIIIDIPIATQIVGFTNEAPTTVNFANVFNGTKKGKWFLSLATLDSNYVKLPIPRGSWSTLMALSSSGVPSTIILLATGLAGCDCDEILTMGVPVDPE